MNLGFADRTLLLPFGSNRPGSALAPLESVTIHETGNENAGANAYMHYKYWKPGGGGRAISSAHFVCDEHESIQLIPINEQAWHAGDRTGNTTSVGIEICVNSRAGFKKACERAAKITALVLIEANKAAIKDQTIRKHLSWPGTTHDECPLHLTDGDWGVTWQAFCNMVAAAHPPGGAPPSGPATGPTQPLVDYAALWGDKVKYVPEFGTAACWRREHTMGRHLGKCISPEIYPRHGVAIACFERGYIVWREETNSTSAHLW